MKMRNKGKVYPSSSTSTPTPSPALFPAGDSLSVLNLLPAAILSLAVVLSLEDREVLAYMITRSIKSANPNSSSSAGDNTKKARYSHKSPVFDCDCFDCYTNYWFKWDTSVNRELIHQAIEAFEEKLNSSEQNKKNRKKKEKTSHRRLAGKAFSAPPLDVQDIEVLPPYDVALVEVKGGECAEGEDEEALNAASELLPETTVVVKGATARKVVPDVIGLFNWRLWGLWGPNV